MIVAPCSVKTLSGIATSYDDTLLIRAADVTLKERRPLILLVRETPVHIGHLRLMTQAAEAGAIIMPTVPAFYTRPATIDDIVTQTVGRALDLLHLPHPATPRWHIDSRSPGVKSSNSGGL
jgi:flavin prenyltransferase